MNDDMKYGYIETWIYRNRERKGDSYENNYSNY